MIEIAELKSLSSRTLHQAVTLFDAYLLSRQVDRSALQLLGVTSILVASRYVHNQWLWILKAHSVDIESSVVMRNGLEYKYRVVHLVGC